VQHHSTAQAGGGCDSAPRPLCEQPAPTRRQIAAAKAVRTIADALRDCHPGDRLPIVEFCFETFCAGEPVPAFFHFMKEANFWADMASRAELKAYCVTAFMRLSRADQEAFLAFISRELAA